MIHSDGTHVVSDTNFGELHAWAQRHQVKRHWFHKGRWPHYDLPKGFRTIVFEDVRYHASPRGLLEAMRNGPILEELIAEDRAYNGITHPKRKEPIA